MTIAHTKLTAKGKISVPAEVQRKLGIGPGSVLEWDQQGEHFVVRRVGKHSSEDIHRAILATPPTPRNLEDLKPGIAAHIQRRHPRR